MRTETVTRSLYVIGELGSSVVKIGIADCPKARAYQLGRDSTLVPASVNREALVVLYQQRGGRALEKALHARFNHRRVLGEWFDLGPVAVSLIRSVIREVT